MCRVVSFDDRARAIGVLCGTAGVADVVDAHVGLVAAAEPSSLYTSDPVELRRLLRVTGGDVRIVRCLTVQEERKPDRLSPIGLSFHPNSRPSLHRMAWSLRGIGVHGGARGAMPPAANTAQKPTPIAAPKLKP